MSSVRIVRGEYRNKVISNQVFALVSGFQTGAKGSYVTVENNGAFPNCPNPIRVRVDSIEDVEYTTAMTHDNVIKLEQPARTQETDEDAMSRIRERFEILHEMTKATVAGDIRAMIVSGPPGVGKSFGVEKEIDKARAGDGVAE